MDAEFVMVIADVTDCVGEADPEEDSVPVCELEALGEGVLEPELELETVTVIEGVIEALEDKLAVGETETLGEDVDDTEPEEETVTETVGDVDTLEDDEGVPVVETDRVDEAVGDFVVETVAVVVLEAGGDLVELGVTCALMFVTMNAINKIKSFTIVPPKKRALLKFKSALRKIVP